MFWFSYIGREPVILFDIVRKNVLFIFYFEAQIVKRLKGLCVSLWWLDEKPSQVISCKSDPKKPLWRQQFGQNQDINQLSGWDFKDHSSGPFGLKFVAKWRTSMAGIFAETFHCIDIDSQPDTWISCSWHRSNICTHKIFFFTTVEFLEQKRAQGTRSHKTIP